jgi:hypothetical protein
LTSTCACHAEEEDGGLGDTRQRAQRLLQEMEREKKAAQAFVSHLAAIAGDVEDNRQEAPAELPAAPPQAYENASSQRARELLQRADAEVDAWSRMLHKLRLAERGL